MRCTASVADRTVTCGEATLAGPSALRAQLDQHVLGGQGVYVRLASSGVAYNAGTSIYSFAATVQDLSTVALATSDGATRHPDGVRAFLADGPTTTGGTGTITVANATDVGTFTASNQPYFQYGGAIGGVDQPELGADGILSSSEISSAKTWQFNVPATVTSFDFTVYVATEMPTVAAATAAPQVASVSANPMVPAATVTLTGTNFNPTPASNTVLIGGRAATVTGGDATHLQVVVPCVNTGSTAVNVTTGGMRGADFSQPVQAVQRTLAVGQSLVLTTAIDSYCNELPAAGGAARYIVSVFSDNTSPASNSPMQFSGSGGVVPSGYVQGPVAAADEGLRAPAGAAPAAGDQKHLRRIDEDARQYLSLRTRFGGRTASSQSRIGSARFSVIPATTRTFRISNQNATSPNTVCNSYYVISATRVYYNGKVAIYEDDATPSAFLSTNNPTMAGYYSQIGDQFNADIEPVISTNFGNLLLRDATTDDNGVEVLVFSPRLNTSFASVVGFTTTCDQFPNDDSSTPAVGGPYTGSGGSTNGASNFGEVYYGYQPVTAGSGYSGNTADNWYRTIRTNIVHESKHIASYSARVANNAPAYEAGWLEESTARVAEELWARSIDGLAWKADSPYGSAANPIGVYCEQRPTGYAECLTNTRRPFIAMQSHFTSMYTELFGTNARLLSPFGATSSDNAKYYYNVGWSLVRYTMDRYASTEAAFLTALTNSTTSGPTNLTAAAGANIDALLGGWALSLYADNYPGLTGSHPDIEMPTWNFRSIYAGLNADFPATYTLAYPLVPQQRAFGDFALASITTLRGGGVLWYELSGTQTLNQLLRLETNGGGLPSSSLRIAIARLQ